MEDEQLSPKDSWSRARASLYVARSGTLASGWDLVRAQKGRWDRWGGEIAPPWEFSSGSGIVWTATHDRYLLCRYDKYGLRTVTPKTTSLRSARWLCTLWVVVPVNVPLGPDTQRVSLVNLLLLRQAVGVPN